MVAGAIKEMDAFALFGFRVQPDQLAGIPRIFIGRSAFDNFAFGAAAGVGLDPFIREFPKFLGCNIFIRKFRPHERSRFIRRGNAFHTLCGRQVNPLFVIACDFSVAQNGGAPDICGCRKNRNRFVADFVTGPFECPKLHLPGC